MSARGPGAMTAALAQRLGNESVTAVEPSASFVSALRERLPDIDVRQAHAEHLPFSDGEFDLTVAQLVVHFVSDPKAGIAQMARVTRRGGLVSACVWDHAADSDHWPRSGEPSATSTRPHPTNPTSRAYVRGQLVELFRQAGLDHVAETTLTVHVPRLPTSNPGGNHSLSVSARPAITATPLTAIAHISRLVHVSFR